MFRHTAALLSRKQELSPLASKSKTLGIKDISERQLSRQFLIISKNVVIKRSPLLKTDHEILQNPAALKMSIMRLDIVFIYACFTVADIDANISFWLWLK